MTIQEGTYILVNKKSGTVLDLSGTDGTSILGWNRHDGDNQKWTVERDNDLWTFRNVGTGKYLGLPGEEMDGAPLRAVNDPYAWEIKADDDAHRIFVPNTSFNVDLSDHGNTDNGTPVTVWGTWSPGPNQVWEFAQGKR